jgi:hypothetical protein
MDSPLENENYSISQVVAMLAKISTVSIAAGGTILTVPNTPINIVYLSAPAPVTITSIGVSSNGYIILIIAENDNITIQSNANINLNSLPAGTDFDMVQYDILALIYKDGVYQELFRTEKN